MILVRWDRRCSSLLQEKVGISTNNWRFHVPKSYHRVGFYYWGFSLFLNLKRRTIFFIFTSCRAHQIVSPILNSESTSFLTNICYDFFFNYQTKKKNLLLTNKKLFNFSTPQHVKVWWTKLGKQIGKTSDEFVKILGFRIRLTLIHFRGARKQTQFLKNL